jgi:phage-related protein
MSDAQARILVIAEMNDRLSAALQRINGQLSNTVRSLNGLKATSQSAVGATNAVGAAITQLSRHSNSLNGSLRGNVLSQHALSVSFKNSAAQANALQMQLSRLRSNGLDVTPLRAYISQLRVMNSMQKQVGNSMRAMNFQQMGTQLNAFSQRMTNAGTRMSMGLTLPLVAFFRMGFSSFRALDKQVIRSTKLMADSFDDSVKNTTGAAKGYTDLQYAVKTLGDGLDKITSKWGISRELVQGLAGDFAELGISSPESLARLTELTVEFEKLGNIDITQAQSTIQAMYQTISRIRTDKGLDVTSSASLKQMTEEIDGAIAFFNFAENKTTLSLNNIAEAFPEVTAAATSFGLNMQTTAALLVPMIGASFQVGASANSIKVSLQRMVATTKQNKDMLEDLSKTIGKDFVPSLGLGSTGLLDLIRNYDLLKERMSKADQLIFFSKLFGVRQGPRMEVAIAQLNKYSKSLEKTGTKEREMAKDAENAVNAQLKLAGFTAKKDKIKIDNIVDIANLTSAAQEMDKDGNYTSKALTIQAGQEVALFNLRNKNQALIKNGVKQYDIAGRIILDNTKKQQKQNKAGEEFNDIQTEGGKLFQAQIFGKALTEDNKNDELKRVQNSVEVSYGRAREAAKSIARELTSVFAGILEQVNPIIERVAKFFRELSDPVKKILGVMLILLALIGPLMRTIGAVGQLGALFNNARAGGIKRFKGNVVELNQSLMKTSDIALRIGGNFKKFGQDGKIFTSRKDAKRLEKLAPIMAKVDAGEELNAKEKAKGTKYVKKLAGREAVLDQTALLPKGVQNLKGLDMATRDYIKSLDPVVQADKMVNELLTEHSRKRTSILAKAAKALARLAPQVNVRPASNNTPTVPIYPTPTGRPIPPPIYPTPTGAPLAAVTAPIVSLRDILTQILASIQAIQACVCNAKAAATGRPSPAASGAPTNAPPAGATAPSITPVSIRPRATTATGTSAPAGAAATAVTGPITAATVATKQAYAELVMQSPMFQKYGATLRDFVAVTKVFSVSAKQAIAKGVLPNQMFSLAKQFSQDATLTKVFLEKYGIDINKVVDQYRQEVVNARNNLVAGARPVAPAGVPTPAQSLPANFMNPMGVINAMKPVVPSAPSAPAQSLPANFMNPMALVNAMAPISLQPAVDKATHAVAEAVMVSIGKKPIAPAASPIPPAIEAATATAEETVATDVKQKAKRGRGRPKAAGPIPAAIDIAVAEGEKTVAEAIVADTKKTRGRPKGTTKKPKPVATGFAGDYGTGYAKSIIEANQSVKTMVQGAFNSAEQASVDFKAVGVSIAKALNLDSTKATVALTRESLIQLFNILGQQAPEKLLQLDRLVDKEGNAIKVKIDTLAKIAGSIATGAAGKAMSPGARSGAGFTGTESVSKGVRNPLYAKSFNEEINRATSSRQSRAFTVVRPGDAAAAKESIQQMKDFESDRSVIAEKVKVLADQARVIKGNIDGLVAQESRATKVGDLSLARILQIKILSEKRKMSDVQRAISELKRTSSQVNTELQSVRQSANVAFNNAQEQMALRGLTTFAGTKGKGMPFGSSTARGRAKRTGERYMGLAYGEKTSDAYLERKQVARPSYSRNDPEEITRQAKRDALAPRRQAGLEIAREAITKQPEYIAREKRRAAQAAKDKAFEARQEADRLAKQQEAALKKLGVKPEKVEPVQSSPVTKGFMPKEQFLAGQAENLQSLNEQIKAANDSARSAKTAVKNLETQIQEVTESKKRIPGGKKNAISELKTRLEDAKNKAEEAKAAAKAAKDEIARINSYDPAKGGLPARTAAPDISAAVRPKSLSAAAASGPTMLNALNQQLASTLQMPTQMLDAFVQTLKIKGGGLAELATGTESALREELVLLQQALQKIGLTVQEAIQDPVKAMTLLGKNKAFTKGGVNEVFQRLVLFQKTVNQEIQSGLDATAAVESAKARTIARFQKTGTSETAPTSKPATSAPDGKKPAAKAASKTDQDAAVSAVMKSINDTKTATDEFLRFTDRPLRKLAEQIRDKVKNDPALQGKDIVVDPKAPMELRRQQIVNALQAMGVAVEKAIVTEVITPVNAAKDAVTTTAATAAGATADETAKVVEAEKNLTVAVEKTIADAAKAVTISANAAANPRLAAIASGVKLSPLASATSAVSGPKVTDSTPAVPLRNPVNAPHIRAIQSTSSGMTNDAAVIAELLTQLKTFSARQVAEVIKMIQEVTRGARGAKVSAEFTRINGGTIPEYLAYLDGVVQTKLIQEAEKVKATVTRVTAVTVTPAPPIPPVAPIPPVTPIPPVISPVSIPTPTIGPKGSGVNVSSETQRRLDIARNATGVPTVPAPAIPSIPVPTGVNLREILAARVAENAAMAERIRHNVALSQAIRERKAASDAASRADAMARRALDPTSIASVPTPTRPSTRVAPPSYITRREMPKTVIARTGEVAKTAATGVINTMFNPMTTIRGIVKTGGLIGAALEGVAKKVSPKRFGSQDVYKARDYGAEARKVTYGARSVEDPMLGPITVKGRDRQRRLAERESRVVAKETRATDRPNRNIARLTQSQLPSQFRQAINPSIDTLKAIAKTYGPPIKSAMNFAKKKSIEGLKIAGQVTRELTLLPIKVPIVFTTGLVEAHKFAMKGVRAGIAKLDSIAFFNTTYTGAAIITLAITLEKGLTKLGSAMTMGGQGLLTSGQIAAKFIQTAFTNPKQALAMASTGLTNSKDLLFKAGAGLVAAASSIKVGAIKLAQSAGSAVAAGAKMAGGAIANAAMAPVRGVKTMFVGGSTFVPQGTDAAGNPIATKKGGLFRRSVTQTTDATTGMMTEQRGKGMFGRMKGGLGKGVMGGIRGLGTAAGSMSSMMLYQLGPAGMALQGPLNKVIGLLTKTKMAFFGVTLPILLVVGAIFLLKKTFSAYGDKTTGVAENFKKAFAAIMVVVNLLKRAFFDFFASLFGGAESSGQATGNIATVVTKVAEATRKFAVAFQAFFTKYILPAIYTMLSGMSMVIKGIFSFVSNLVKFVMAIVSFFRGGGDKAKEAMVGALKGMLRAIVNVLKGILKQWLPILTLLIKAVFKVVEFIVQLFEWLVIGVINLIRQMVTGIINLVFNIVKAYVSIVDMIIDVFVFLQKKLIDISSFIVKGVVKVFFGIIRGVLSVVQKIIEVFGLIPSGLGKIMEKVAGVLGKALGGVSWLARKVGLGDLADGIDKFRDSAKDFTSDIVNFGKETALSLVGGIGKAIDFAENKALGLVDGVANVAKNLSSKLGGLGDSIGRLLQSAQNGLLSGVDAAADATNAFIGGFSDGIDSLGDGLTNWLAGLVDGNDIKQGIGDSIKDAVKNGAKDPSAANEAGRSIAKAIGEGIKSLKDNFYDKVISNLSDSLGKLKDQVTKALEKQKDQSLKFFDDQIAAIDALAAADAELTAEKQKQEDERLRIAERALQRDSFLKNRALAIYEGRIDDARTLGLEEAKNQQEFNKETAKNARDADAAAKSKNIDAAKAVITNQKEAASIQFDSVLEDYQAFLENIGRNGTLTQAELTTQFNELRAKAAGVSTDMQTAFQGYYNALPGLIATNTAPTVGFFTGSMDALIAAAQGRFGLDANSTDPASLLGVTNGMLGNMGLAYTNGFATVVAPAYNDGQESLANIAREFADPSATNPKSAAGIYASAIANATAAVRAEFMKMKTDASSAFAEVVAAINDELKGLAITKAIDDAVKELKDTGGGTTPSGGSATSPATGVTGPTAPTGFGPMGLSRDGFDSLAGKDKVFKLNDSNDYIKTAKAALAFYGFGGFQVDSEKMGTGTVAAIKAFQKKYKIGSASGDLGPVTATKLGLFSGAGVQKKFMGGMIKRAVGGVVPGYSTEGVPAILHGGEYVISSKAVQNLGLGLLTQLNGLKHGVPSFNVPKPQMPNSSGMNMSVTSHSQSETTQNYNFYVDNFIGEDQWFESMMKDYNIKVVPNNQKAAGLESRVVRTYNGINRGM